ncbi:heme ABC transporter ATP-binding protein/permease CydC [Shewanella surugensis]|uniref:Cysteine/glutathione ABC transporter ATP-binding protein/permease CydC n=1 Tax=Shewanella surugensis TaxID=212020 RepID=A0ABT0LE64_9GAMM|nr:cysteine/glutathione ABC transporter ATP-binding protein/permease CydC [Shewanella surugensis]MCL1125620.1 cysteine/glutathione ABC transporter ATP-binding protein/permease CydC [Shewanella surugensis]
MKALIPYLKMFKKQWFMLSVGILLSVTTLLAGIGLLSLSGWFLSAAAVAGLTLVTSQAFNFFTPAAGVRFFSIARTASRYGERLATHQATFQLLTQLRCWVWSKLLPLSAQDLQGIRRGDLLNRLVSDIDTLDHLYLRLITPIFAALCALLGLYFFVSFFDVHLAMVLSGLLLLVLVIMPALFYRLGQKPGRLLVETKRQYRIILLDYIQGQAELTLFGAQHRYREELARIAVKLYSNQKAMANITGLSQTLLIVFHGATLVVLMYLAASGVGSANPPGPMLALIVFMTMATIEMLMPIAGAFQHLSACITSATRVSELTEQTPSISFPRHEDSHSTIDSTLYSTVSNSIESTITNVGKDRVRENNVVEAALAINNLHFSYDGKQSVLSGVNLSIGKGEKVALLGKTGCGKSSILSLVTRDWLADQGSIRLESRNIDELSEAELRQSMTVMSQRVYLFSGTLRDNLILALNEPSSCVPHQNNAEIDEKFINVLQQVGLGVLLEPIEPKCNPLEQWIGEGGRQLSGGEQRRIGVARTLLRDAPLLLLDEPTEGLDKITERDVLRLLFHFAKDKTLLMISHRLTAMPMMDKVHILESGEIRASGTHKALFESDDYYRSLYLSV